MSHWRRWVLSAVAACCSASAVLGVWAWTDDDLGPRTQGRLLGVAVGAVVGAAIIVAASVQDTWLGVRRGSIMLRPQLIWAARRGLRRLGRELDSETGQTGRRPVPNVAAATAAYEVATRLAAGAPKPGELVAVVALAGAGRVALADDSTGPVPLCSVNPLHLLAKRIRRKWWSLGTTTYGLCRWCQEPRRAFEKWVLRVRHDGRYRRYFQTSALWRDTFSEDLAYLVERVRAYLDEAGNRDAGRADPP